MAPQVKVVPVVPTTQEEEIGLPPSGRSGEILREAMDKVVPSYREQELTANPLAVGSTHSFFGFGGLKGVANSKALTILVFASVALNGLQMGVQADIQGDVIDQVCLYMDHTFTGVFTLEFVIKILAFGCDYFQSGWNLFDFFLTWVSILDMWILPLFSDTGGLKILSVLRILRIFRALRLLRMMRSLRELSLIVEGLMKAGKTSSWACMLLILVLYIFSIFCVPTIGRQDSGYPGWSTNTEEYEDVLAFNSYQYFGTVPRSMFTLLQLAMLTDDWYIVSRPMLEKQPGFLLLFLIFVAFTTFGLMNVILGIIVDSVMDSARALNEDSENVEKQKTLAHLKNVYRFVRNLDQNEDNLIQGDELKKAWRSTEVRDLMSIVNLPVGLEADEFLNLLDSNGDGNLSFDEIVLGFVRLLTSDQNQQIYELKATLNALKRDMVCMRRSVDNLPAHEALVSEMAGYMQQQNDQICDLKEYMNTLQLNLVCLQKNVSELPAQICESMQKQGRQESKPIPADLTLMNGATSSSELVNIPPDMVHNAIQNIPLDMMNVNSDMRSVKLLAVHHCKVADPGLEASPLAGPEGNCIGDLRVSQPEEQEDRTSSTQDSSAVTDSIKELRSEFSSQILELKNCLNNLQSDMVGLKELPAQITEIVHNQQCVAIQASLPDGVTMQSDIPSDLPSVRLLALNHCKVVGTAPASSSQGRSVEGESSDPIAFSSSSSQLSVIEAASEPNDEFKSGVEEIKHMLATLTLTEMAENHQEDQGVDVW